MARVAALGKNCVRNGEGKCESGLHARYMHRVNESGEREWGRGGGLSGGRRTSRVRRSVILDSCECETS